MIHAAAVALIHSDYIHSCRQSVPRDAQHVLRIMRALKAMDNNECQRLLPVVALLVMSPAAHLDARRNFHETFFRWRQMNSSRQQKARDGLQMPTA